MLHETELKRNIGNRLVAQPLLHVVGHVDTFLLTPINLGQNSLVLALAKILEKSILHELSVVDDGPVELANLTETELDIFGASRSESLPHEINFSIDLIKGRVLQGPDGVR